MQWKLKSFYEKISISTYNHITSQQSTFRRVETKRSMLLHSIPKYLSNFYISIHTLLIFPYNLLLLGELDLWPHRYLKLSGK